MNILISAFDPFGGEHLNPAQEVLALLPDKAEGINIKKVIVPTVFYQSIDVLTKAIDEYRPDAVLLLGQAGGRNGITVERVAINVSDAELADNEEQTPTDEAIAPDGPAAYFATLPIKKMVEAVMDIGLPAQVSNSAGTFVCNHLLYGVLHHIKISGLNCRAGFVHLPFLPEQAEKYTPPKPSMPLLDQVKGVTAMLRSLTAE